MHNCIVEFAFYYAFAFYYSHEALFFPLLHDQYMTNFQVMMH